MTAVVFAVVYVWLYASIVRFRTPRWLVSNNIAANAVPEQTHHA
jgi:hypothetical protein